MNMPQNYEELRTQAIEEMNNQAWALEDRADVMRKFVSHTDACEEWSWDTYQEALAVADIEDNNDCDGIESFYEIVDHWPDVSWEPGKGGYW